MGCQSSKQSENAKTRKSKLSKPDANEKTNVTPNIASQPAIKKLQSERSKKEIPAEKVTFSSGEPNDEMGSSAERAVNRKADLKVKRVVSRSMESNEEAVSDWNQSKKDKLRRHKSEQNLVSNKEHKYLDGKLNKKYMLNSSKQLQIRTKTKRNRADPEDDTLYEVPLKMPEFDLMTPRPEDSVA
ncbi:hypothetical protein ACH3XW_23540 [Acanthocheilonema viteae]